MQCQKVGCPHKADHAVKICVPRFGQGMESDYFGFLMDIQLCEDHIDEFDAVELLKHNPDLQTMFRLNVSHPDFDRAYCVGVPLVSPEYGAMKLSANPTVN